MCKPSAEEESVDSAVKRLLDENDIRAITAVYSDAVSHLDAGRAASIYIDAGIVEITGNRITGRAAIEAGMRQSFAEFRLLQLIAHGGLIVVEGDHARARWSTIELTVRQNSTNLNIIFGRYEDKLVRLSEGWRFEHRVFSMAGRSQVELGKLQFDPTFFDTLTYFT